MRSHLCREQQISVNLWTDLRATDGHPCSIHNIYPSYLRRSKFVDKFCSGYNLVII